MTITKSGQVTLPKELREFLGVKLGGKITFHKSQNEVYISRRLSDEEFLRRLESIHRKYGSPSQGLPDAADAVRAYREGEISALRSEYEEKFA